MRACAKGGEKDEKGKKTERRDARRRRAGPLTAHRRIDAGLSAYSRSSPGHGASGLLLVPGIPLRLAGSARRV